MVAKGLLEAGTDKRGGNEGKVLVLEGTQQETSLAEERVSAPSESEECVGADTV